MTNDIFILVHRDDGLQLISPSNANITETEQIIVNFWGLILDIFG